MLRGFAFGLLAGAILGGLLFRIFASREDGSDTPPGGSSDIAGSTGASRSSSPDLEIERETARRLSARISELEAEVATLKKSPAPGGTPAKKPDRSAKWKELASLIAKARADADATGGEMNNDSWLGPLLALIGTVADDEGIPVQEMVMSPDWYPNFMKSILEASPYPMTEEQRKAFEESLAGSRDAWGKYMAARGTMTSLEKAKALRDLQYDMYGKLTPLGTEQQKAYIASLKLPPPNAPYQGVWNGKGTREQVKANITNNWSKSLGLDAAQMTALEPAIDSYMRSYDALGAEAERRRRAGEPFDDVGAKLALALEAQKAIGERVRLTEAQARALREWTQVNDYQLKE